MPSIDGGSQTSIDYAPHMYILRAGGNAKSDEDYIFVGNAQATYDDSHTFGTTYEEKLARVATLATEAFHSKYHIGVSQVEGFVGDVRTEKLEVTEIREKRYLISTYVQGSHKGIPTLEIPEAAKKALIKEGLKEIATLSGQIILGGLGIEIPADLVPEPLDFDNLFNGSPEVRAAELAKNEQWQKVAEALRQTLGIE